MNVLESACNKAQLEGLLDMRAIEELLERRASHPRAARLRSALAVDGFGLGRTKSKLEKLFLRLSRQTCLPAPAVNEWMPIPTEEIQCVFVWHRERLVVEVDGWEWHRTRKAFEDDRRRAGCSGSLDGRFCASPTGTSLTTPTTSYTGSARCSSAAPRRPRSSDRRAAHPPQR
jgi:hypothetical protein